MAVKPLNSIAGFSTGDPAITIVQANGDITTINFTANGISNLGSVTNVHITGGTSGQAITTDGNGNLTFSTISVESNRAAPMPYLIPTGQSYIVNENFQGLYSQPITIDGEMVIDGMLIEISDTSQSTDNQVLFDLNGVPTGNAGFEFQYWDGNLNVPGNINIAGSIIPEVDDTYDLGTANYRWRNGYFGGNTIFLGESIISSGAGGNLILESGSGATITVAGDANTSIIENGTSNITIDIDSDIRFGVGGTANVLVLTSNGIDYDGNLIVNGNITANGGDFVLIKTGSANANISLVDDDILINAGNNGNLVFGGGAFVANKIVANANVSAGNILTDHLLYANGTAWDLGGNPGGSNTQLQFNNAGEFGGSANLSFNTTTNNLAITGNIVVSTGALYGNAAGLTNIPGANISGNISGNISNAAHAGTANTVVNNSQPNITSVGTLTNLSVSGNALISGNLTVDGNLIYVNVEELSVEDPIINLNTGANGAAPVSNSGKDVGTALNYYDTQARVAFMGWDTSNAEFAFGSQTTIASEVVTFNTLGNVRAQTFKGNVEATTIAGNLTTATQSNITTVGTLGSLAVSGNATANNFTSANVVSANYLISTSGCVSVNGAFLAYNSGTGAAGIFTSGATDINLGLAANVIIGSLTGTSNIRNELLVGGNANITGNLSANLISGTLSTAAQPNITSIGTLSNLSVTGNVTSNIANVNTIQTNSVISKRTAVSVTTLTVIDSFSINDYRSAKYVISSQNDLGYESLEVLLIHNDINSYVTVYGAINDGGGNTVTISTGVNSGNVELRATGSASNTEIKLVGIYIPVI